MSTNKNTFKYLCIIFGIIFFHLALNIIFWSLSPDGTVTLYTGIADLIFLSLLISVSVLFSARYAGQGKSFQKKKVVAITVICSIFLAAIIILIDFFVLIFGGFSDNPFIALPIFQFLCVIAAVFGALTLCKLALSKGSINFPRGKYLLACLIPMLLYFVLGLLLMLADQWKLLSFMDKFDYYAVSNLFIFYCFGLYMAIQELSIGWSVFCMMKYNQSMKIKKLLEMQMANMTENT